MINPDVRPSAKKSISNLPGPLYTLTITLLPTLSSASGYKGVILVVLEDLGSLFGHALQDGLVSRHVGSVLT